MLHHPLELSLYEEMAKIPLVDVHSHIDPLKPAASSLDDLLGYHYFTELAHSAGMPKNCLAADFDPRERCRQILKYATHFDNTVQFDWLTEIARSFLGLMGERLEPADGDRLWDLAYRKFNQPDWEAQVLRTTNLECVFLTNDFDDPLEGFDRQRYVPCLRVDDLVFGLKQEAVRRRLATCVNQEVSTARHLNSALENRFDHFLRAGAKACAVSLPPTFAPYPVADAELDQALLGKDAASEAICAAGVFWRIAEKCQDQRLPFDLMIGVNRKVYPSGVHQGQDLFDQRTSLIQFAKLFNAFPGVPFCVSVLSSGQNQELASYSWIFPNVICNGHWWYSNLPNYIERDCQARLEAVPKTKLLGYYSDAYKLEFVLPKFNMYRQTLARVLAREFVLTRGWSETQALDLARLLLRDNPRRIFHLD